MRLPLVSGVLILLLQMTTGVIPAFGAASKPISLPKLSPNTPQGMEGGFWKVDNNFDPVIRLKNVLLNQPLSVTPILYFADGTEYPLPLVTLEPAGVWQINIRIALQSVPANLASHVSAYGMAGISYQWSWSAVVATIQNTDEIASLTVTNSFQADVRQVHANPAASQAQVTRGLWWLPTANADGYLVLENPSLFTKQVDVQFSGHAGNTLATQQVSLSSHATTVISLSSALGNARGTETTGGIEIHYTGPDHGIAAYAGIEDGAVGYSASPILLEDHLDPDRPVHAVTLSAPGLQLGNADPTMQFPSGTYFTPYTYLHNVSANPLQVSLSLVSPGADSIPQTRSLGTVTIQPEETSQFDFASQFSAANPLPNGYGHLTASFQGHDGDLQIAAGSADQSQSYVFEVNPSQQADSASRSLCFWSVEGDSDTMITVWNYKAAAQDMVLTLYYSGGQYAIPIHLAALQSYNLDMMTLIRSRVPDPTGTQIPSNITSGSGLLSGPGGDLDKISVAVSASVFNVRNATCGYVCITCNGATQLSYQSSPIQLAVKGSNAATVQLTMNTGSVTNNPSGGTWYTSNAAVATVNSSGVHTGVSIGTATSTFLLTSVPVYTKICGPVGISCPTEGLTADDAIDDDLEVLGETPPAVYLGQSGTFIFPGQGFSAAGTPSVQVSGVGNVTTEQPVVIGDSTINVPYSVAPNATPGQDTIAISFSDGDGGQGYTQSFPVSVVVPAVSITQLQYTNNLPVWQDSSSNITPTVMSNIVWTPSSTLPSVFVSGTAINATATFSISPAPTSTMSVRIEGAISGLGLLVANSVSISAGATSFTATLTGNTPFPSNQTFHNPALPITWSISYGGQQCAGSTCYGAGTTASEVFATLATPSGVSVSPIPLTAVMLAIGGGGATSPAAALQNTWQQFAGPANVDGWVPHGTQPSSRPLYYYRPNYGFNGTCAYNSVGLLTSPIDSGQCRSFAVLLQDALAVNGITGTSIIQVFPTDQSVMLVNSWTFGSQSHLYNPPYNWNLALPIESGGYPGMVPIPSGSVFGGLTSLSTLPGQNTAPPAEKVFTQHFILLAPSSLGLDEPYLDPSYGVTYAGACDFQSTSVAGYAHQEASTGSTVNFEVRQPTATNCNITFTVTTTN